jgi:hypothetical protein
MHAIRSQKMTVHAKLDKFARVLSNGFRKTGIK